MTQGPLSPLCPLLRGQSQRSQRFNHLTGPGLLWGIASILIVLTFLGKYPVFLILPNHNDQ